MMVAVKKRKMQKQTFFLIFQNVFTPVWQTEILTNLQQFFPPKFSKAFFSHS